MKLIEYIFGKKKPEINNFDIVLGNQIDDAMKTLVDNEKFPLLQKCLKARNKTKK